MFSAFTWGLIATYCLPLAGWSGHPCSTSSSANSVGSNSSSSWRSRRAGEPSRRFPRQGDQRGSAVFGFHGADGEEEPDERCGAIVVKREIQVETVALEEPRADRNLGTPPAWP